MNKHKYISSNMIVTLNWAHSGVTLVRECHTLTLAALLARGAIKFKPIQGGIQVHTTQSGESLLSWAKNAKLLNYRTEALPSIQDLNKRVFE